MPIIESGRRDITIHNAAPNRWRRKNEGRAYKSSRCFLMEKNYVDYLEKEGIEWEEEE